MGFDVENFGLGLIAGWVTGYGVYRARHLISSAIQSASQQASSAQSYASQSTDTRYVNNIIRWAQRNHMAGKMAMLSDILVEPRFIPPFPLAAPPEDEVSHNVFNVVPIVPDIPALHAPYNVPTLSIDELATGDRALALLGNIGSGRTTALMAIMLRALGQLHTTQPTDIVQQKLDAEEAAMDEKKRAVRVKERLLLEQRARERFAEERGMVLDNESDSESDLPLFNRLMPVYINLSDIQIDGGEIGREIDPAEPLVRAVQRQLGRVAASTIPRSLYSRLNRGQVLVLVDGYDELPENERERQLTWLQAFSDSYRDNFLIVTGPAIGYGTLTQTLRLTPVHLRPWSDQDIVRSVDNWADAWPQSKGRRSTVVRPSEEIIAHTKTDCRTLTPTEITFKILANFIESIPASSYEEWVNAFIGRHLTPDQPLETMRPLLINMARLELDEGYFTKARLLTMLGQTTNATQPSQASELALTEPEDSLQEASEPVSDQAKQLTEGRQKSKEETNPYAKLLRTWLGNGLLIRHKGGRYRFRHSYITGHLASMSLTDSQIDLQDKSAETRWRLAVARSAAHTSLGTLVKERLTSPTDIIQSKVFEVALWLANAPKDVEWRIPFLKYLSTIFVAPNQYSLLRERAVAALIVSRDENALQVFKQATKSVVPDVRRLACLGIGAIGSDEGVAEVIQLLQDSDSNVQLAAALGLGAIKSEAALTAMVEAFTEGSEALRQVIAESFADIPQEGYPILYDAIQDDEMMLRRAAVFGIRRLKSDWAMLAIYRAFLEDTQWYVRSAAQIAFQEMRYGGNEGPRNYPPLESIKWLNEWAAAHGENISPDDSANDVLLKAMREGKNEIRAYATANIGQLGMVSLSNPVYQALRDKKSEVRDTAYRALANLQLTMGMSLPTAL
ncbi:MAG: HEAT repeat domain-containing protein [Anaerolineae bacterium]